MRLHLAQHSVHLPYGSDYSHANFIRIEWSSARKFERYNLFSHREATENYWIPNVVDGMYVWLLVMDNTYNTLHTLKPFSQITVERKDQNKIKIIVYYYYMK